MTRKPVEFDKKHLEGPIAIKQTAAAMLTLSECLPLMIGHLVPENSRKWKNLLQLFSIVHISTSPFCLDDTVSNLRCMISSYLQNFKKLYPRASFIPKQHFMLHLPGQMVTHGPLRPQWCMRYEGKNGEVKSKRYFNFKNLPMSIAKHHQKRMASMMICPATGNPNSNFLYEGDVVAEGDEFDFAIEYPFLQNNYGVQACYSSPEVSIHGNKYRPGTALLLEIEEFPLRMTFGIIKEVLVESLNKYFVMEKCTSVPQEHLNTYKLNRTGNLLFVSFYDIKFAWPVPIYMHQGQEMLVNTCGCRTEMF